MAKPGKTGNIGEHSELFALARIILDGQLELGVPNEVVPQTSRSIMDVFGVSRTPPIGTKFFGAKKKKLATEEEVKSRDVLYSSGEDVMVISEPDGIKRRLCSRSELNDAAQGLQQQLIYWSSSKFKSEKRAQKKANEAAGIQSGSKALQSEYSQNILDFLGLKALRAKSGAKSDLYLTLESSGRRIPQGFSVKSQMGSRSCLVNHSGATIFRYEIQNTTLTGAGALEERFIVNEAATAGKPESAVSKKRGPATVIPALLCEPGVVIKYDRVVNSTFKESLEMIDARFPQALAMVILQRFKTGESKIAKLASDPAIKSFLVTDGMSPRVAENYLAEKLKDLLRKFALGMQADTPWKDQAEVQGGWVLVVEGGKVVGYRFDNPDAFRSYLLEFTMIDTPSTKRVKKNTAKVGRVFEQDGKLYITLSLIVKFTK